MMGMMKFHKDKISVIISPISITRSDGMDKWTLERESKKKYRRNHLHNYISL